MDDDPIWVEACFTGDERQALARARKIVERENGQPMTDEEVIIAAISMVARAEAPPSNTTPDR